MRLKLQGSSCCFSPTPFPIPCVSYCSCIYVAWSALFAETTFSRLERVSAIKYSQCAILFSVNVVPITEKITGGLRVGLILPLLVHFLNLRFGRGS